jgi:hypothetical protein
MAVANTFGADYLGQGVGVSLDSPSSTVTPGLILRVPGECAVSLAGVAVLVVLALLALLEHPLCEGGLLCPAWCRGQCVPVRSVSVWGLHIIPFRLSIRACPIY